MFNQKVDKHGATMKEVLIEAGIAAGIIWIGLPYMAELFDKIVPDALKGILKRGDND